MYFSALMATHSVTLKSYYMDSKLDSSCKAKLTDLCDWFDKLCDLGPKYGYHPKLEKCILIGDAEHEAEAKSIFQHLGIMVVKGYCFLGGFIGDSETTRQVLRNTITG